MANWDWFEISTTPTEEPCAVPGIDDYELMSRLECQAWSDQILRKYPKMNVYTRASHHTSGHMVIVVCVRFIVGTEAEREAMDLKWHTPTHWDAQALLYLSVMKYKLKEKRNG